jgi:ABC-type glycerol-3-phosphate transport system substrate-binding protein
MQTLENGVWTDMEDAYKVFENENLKDVLEAYYQLMDMEYAAFGSATHTLDQAQGLIMKDANKQNNAIFMLNGDWFLNEVKANYSRNLDNVTFMNMPVISALGVKLFGEGTAYNLPEAECDELLSYACKLVDENKTIEEIITLVQTEKGITLTQEDAQAVATARGVGAARGIEHLAFITKGSTKKDIAGLVLRMMASDDFAETFMKLANASSPYTKTVKATSPYKFVNAAQAIVSNRHYRAVNFHIEGLRFKVIKSVAYLPGISNVALHLYNKAPNESYADAAETLYKNINATVLAAWNEYKQ